MQRTVKGTKFTYVENTLTENNEIVSALRIIVVNESDPKKAYKLAAKTLGHNFHPIKTEEHAKTYILDDEIFFKYAKPIDENKNTDNESKENEGV